MRQTLALLVDAYRDLNSRMLFWVTLWISIAVVLGLAMFGVEEDGLKFLTWLWEMNDPSLVYRANILSAIVIGIWLSWGAVILALISTGGMFPDLIVSGAIDLYLSKPISRLRLFLTRYFTGLMFVTVQLVVFCSGCFLVVGWRSHEWRPSLFLAIPYVTLLFSYVYGFCVLLGVITRSSIAALLLAIVIWLIISGVDRADTFTATFHRGLDLTVEHYAADARWLNEQEIPRAEHEKKFLDLRPGLLRKQEKYDQERVAEATSRLGIIRKFHRVLSLVHAILPKTVETNNLLDRRLIDDNEIPSAPREAGNAPPPVFGVSIKELVAAAHDIEISQRHESPTYIIGSSLLCEAVIVCFAAWIFCRRDY